MKRSRKAKKGPGTVEPAAEQRRRGGVLVLVAALLALGVFVAGCGGDGDDETAAPPAETTAPEETTEPGEEEEEAPQGEAEGEAGEQPGEAQAGGIEVSEGDPKAGKTIFADNCSVCHGSEGSGGNVGPSLQEAQLAQEEEAVLVQIIEGGNGMPPFGGQLSDQEIADVAAYVVEDLAKR